MPTSQIMILSELISIICGSGGCWTNPGGHHAWHHEHHEGSSKPLPAQCLELGHQVEDGLSALGYGSEDVDQLVEGALPQDRVNKLAPRFR